MSKDTVSAATGGKEHVSHLILRKQALEQQIFRLKCNRSTVEQNKSHLGREAAEARSRCNHYLADHANGAEKALTPNRLSEFHNMKRDRDVKIEAVEAALKEISRIDASIETAQEQLDALTFGDGLDDVIAFDDDFAKAKATVAELQEGIKVQKDAIAAANASIPLPSASLANRREDLLAEIAIGKADESEIDDVDKQIAEERTAISAAKARVEEPIRRAEHTIAGLERKLGQAQADLDRLTRTRPELLYRFLRGQAEAIYGEYRTLADDLRQNFERIVAINGLMENVKPKDVSGTILGAVALFRVPAFHLAGDPSADSAKLLASHQGFDLPKAMAEEKERLQALGVDCL